MNRTAQGIASKGRFGDTTLVHMAPSELKGIEQLAGMPVTYNPETGLPEMFNFKEFMAIAAPIAGAALLGPAAAAHFGGSALAGAVGAGGGAALGTLAAGGNSDEALQAGLITGITAGIGGSMAGGKEAAGATGGGAGGGGGAANAGNTVSNVTAEAAANPAFGNIGTQGAGSLSAAPPMANPVNPNTGLMSAGPGNVSFLQSGADASINANAGVNAGSGGQGIMGAFRNTQAYQNPTQALGYGTAGGVGGLSVLPGVADTLVDDSPKYGDVDMSDPYRRRVTYRRGLGSREGQFFDPSGMYIKEGGYIKKMQEGGEVAGGATPSVNDAFVGGDLMQFAPGIAGGLMAPAPSTPMGAGNYNYMDYAPSAPMQGIPAAGSTVETTNFQGVNPSALRDVARDVAREEMNNTYLKFMGNRIKVPVQATAMKDAYIERFGQDAYNEDFGYNEGGTVGIVKGPGDGMSDSIYGTMRDVPNQRVALSDGEFVVPSDIVSGIGNGSTDAGAEKLYAMMDRVRNARTGQVQQAPEINPEEFLPA
jgi:hypothetical protein